MIIPKEIEKRYKNQIEIIKSEQDNKIESKLIGALVSDIGGRCISLVAKLINHCRQKVKKDYLNYINGEQLSFEFRGRKKLIDKYPNLIKDIESVIENYKNVDSHFKSDKTYVSLTPSIIIEELVKNYNYPPKFACYNSIKKIINKLGYKLHRIPKELIYKRIEETNEIFNNINDVKESIKASNDTVAAISIDDKATKKLGKISDNGKTILDIKALDHDTIINGSLKPFGILDIKTNKTFVTCTEYCSTADFKIDCIDEYLNYKTKEHSLRKLYILLDNGPENSGRRKLWLKCLCKLAKKYNIVIELAYYPPYCSKYNLIERYWARLQMFWNKIIIETKEELINVINKCTWNNVKTTAKINEKEYTKGKDVSYFEMEEIEEKQIIRDEKIKNWSIVITP